MTVMLEVDLNLWQTPHMTILAVPTPLPLSFPVGALTAFSCFQSISIALD
jgi:hypothetical protein